MAAVTSCENALLTWLVFLDWVREGRFPVFTAIMWVNFFLEKKKGL